MSETADFKIFEGELTPETFIESIRNEYGDCGYEGDRLDRLVGLASTMYSDLPYHNFRHALETVWDALRLAKLYEENGGSVNRKAIVAAALFHDANYHLDHTNTEFEDRIFDIKEAYSAAIFENLPDEFGLSQDDIAEASQAINATYLYATPVSITDKIIVRADIGNVRGEYETSFMRKNELLRQEQIRSQNIPEKLFDNTAFAASTVKVLAIYLSKDLSLGDQDKEWSDNSVVNVYRFFKSYAPEHGSREVDMAKGLGETVFKLFAKQLLRTGAKKYDEPE